MVRGDAGDGQIQKRKVLGPSGSVGQRGEPHGEGRGFRSRSFQRENSRIQSKDNRVHENLASAERANEGVPPYQPTKLQPVNDTTKRRRRHKTADRYKRTTKQQEDKSSEQDDTIYFEQTRHSHVGLHWGSLARILRYLIEFQAGHLGGVIESNNGPLMVRGHVSQNWILYSQLTSG